MRLKITLFNILFLLIANMVTAQSESYSIKGKSDFRNGEVNLISSIEQKSEVDLRSIHLWYTNQSYSKLEYTYSKASDDDWIPFYPDLHANEGKETNELISTLIVVPQDARSIRLRFYSEDAVSLDYKLEVIYHEFESRPSESVEDKLRECLCPMPDFINRVGWDCPWGEDSTIFVPTYSPISHIVVHHQAGSAVAPYASTVRAIWNYHVNSNGWSDIGYHWLIDPDGVVYKGRAWLDGDQNVQGAHMCACNSFKMGICLLGDLTNNGPTEAQYESLVNFIAAKGCELDIPPIELNEVVARTSGNCIEELTPRVIGHKQGCPSGWTECPGNAFVPKFEIMVEDAQGKYEACVGNVSSTNDQADGVVSVFPNPNTGQFMIKGHLQISQLSITNTKGQVMHTDTHPIEEKLDLDLPSGTYQLSIKTKGGSFYTQQLIIQK